MKKNVAGQTIGAQIINATSGAAFTGTVSAFVTVDGGTQAAGGGTVTHEGNGYHSYAPTQAETDGDHIAFTFTGTGAVPATVQVYTTFPQTADPSVTGVSSVVGNVDGSTASVTGAVGSVTAPVTVGTNNDKTGYSGVVTSGTVTTVSGNVNGSVGSVVADVDISAASVDDVWNELQSGHTTVGTFGYYLDAQVSAAGGGGSADWTAGEREQIRDALGVTGTKTTAIGGQIQDILTDTAEIGAAGAGLTEAGGTGDQLTAINLPDQTMNITGSLSGSVGSVTAGVTVTTNNDKTGYSGTVTGGTVDSVTGNVGGNVVGSVGSVVAPVTAGTVSDKTGYSIAGTKTTLDALNDIAAADVLAAGDIDGYSLEDAQKIQLSSAGGVLSGAATEEIVIQAADASKARITAQVDESGNRTSVVLDGVG